MALSVYLSHSSTVFALLMTCCSCRCSTINPTKVVTVPTCTTTPSTLQPPNPHTTPSVTMFSKFVALASVLAVATATIELAAFPAATLLVGSAPGTAFVLSSAQVTVAAAAVAGLAIAKQALTLAAVADSGRRGKRAALQLDFSQMFEGVDAQDSADCGKLLVCHSVAKDQILRTGEERAIAALFDDVEAIQANAYGKYQWAAYAGSFKNPTLCAQRYSTCPVNPEALSNLINVQ